MPEEQRWHVSGTWCEHLAVMTVVASTEAEAIAKAKAYWQAHGVELVDGLDWDATSEARLRELHENHALIHADVDEVLAREPRYFGSYRYPY
jgi:alkanesulfonate monooxygenase SsuD/methylene tetrahydromethanopterin reductase-like flavin-dependent oxidoreductase (luciferase family)